MAAGGHQLPPWVLHSLAGGRWRLHLRITRVLPPLTLMELLLASQMRRQGGKMMKLPGRRQRWKRDLGNWRRQG